MFLDCFFSFVCVSIVDFWFVVPMRFCYSSLYISMIVFVTGLLISNAFSVFCICVLFLALLVLMSYLCVDVSCFCFMLAFTGGFCDCSFLIFNRGLFYLEKFLWQLLQVILWH